MNADDEDEPAEELHEPPLDPSEPPSALSHATVGHTDVKEGEEAAKGEHDQQHAEGTHVKHELPGANHHAEQEHAEAVDHTEHPAIIDLDEEEPADNPSLGEGFGISEPAPPPELEVGGPDDDMPSSFPRADGQEDIEVKTEGVGEGRHSIIISKKHETTVTPHIPSPKAPKVSPTAVIKAKQCIPLPQEVDISSFFNNLKLLQEYIKKGGGGEGAAEDLSNVRRMVNALKEEMTCLRGFCEATQEQMETVRAPIRSIIGEIHKAITEAGAAVKEAGRSIEELDVDARHQQIYAQLAIINGALVEASKLIAETESAAVTAAKEAVEAVELAKRVQAEMEKKLKQEEEEKKAAEELARVVAAKKAEEERIAAELRAEAERLREAREAGLIEVTPPFALMIESHNEFDNGVGCVVQVEPEVLVQDQITCWVVDIMDANFEFIEREELISCVIQIGPTDPEMGKELCGPMTLAIPHCLTRQQAAFREPVIKMEISTVVLPGKSGSTWKEMETTEATLEGFKDLKFAQTAYAHAFGKYAVVARLRKETIKMRKRGGTMTSKLDERVTFVTDEDTFATRERLTFQMQPVDTISFTELKRRMDIAKQLLCTTSIFRFSWTNQSFESPVVVTMPLPPNPVTVRKLAGQHVAKEKRKASMVGEIDEELLEKIAKEEDDATPATSISGPSRGPSVAGETDEKKAETRASGEKKSSKVDEQAVEEARKSGEGDGEEEEEEDEEDEEGAAKKSKKKDKKRRGKKNEESEEMRALWNRPVNWYMGQYGKDTDEDERDQLIVVRLNDHKNRWTVEQYRVQVPQKTDAVQIEIPEPVQAIVVFRMQLSAKEREAEMIAEELIKILSQRMVTFILKQQSEDACNVVAYVVPTTRKDRVIRKLADEDYIGPEPSDVFAVKEGDRLCLNFRGNIQCVSDEKFLAAIYCSNLDTKFDLKVRENDIYLQKSYDVYRGFVQLSFVYQIPYKPPDPKEAEDPDDMSPKAAKAAALKAAEDAQKAEEAEAAEAETAAAEEAAAAEKEAAAAAAEAAAAEKAAAGGDAGEETTAGEEHAHSEAEEAPRDSKGVEGEASRGSMGVDGEESTTSQEAIGDGGLAAKDPAAVVAVPEKEPPMPAFETKMDTLTELLLTFPKNIALIKAKPPKKAPVTYLADGDNITIDILAKIAENIQSEDEWGKIVQELEVNSHVIDVIIRTAALNKKTSVAEVRFEILLQWVKKLMKQTNKADIIMTALKIAGREDIATAILNRIAANKTEEVALAPEEDILTWQVPAENSVPHVKLVASSRDSAGGITSLMGKAAILTPEQLAELQLLGPPKKPVLNQFEDPFENTEGTGQEEGLLGRVSTLGVGEPDGREVPPEASPTASYQDLPLREFAVADQNRISATHMHRKTRASQQDINAEEHFAAADVVRDTDRLSTIQKMELTKLQLIEVEKVDDDPEATEAEKLAAGEIPTEGEKPVEEAGKETEPSFTKEMFELVAEGDEPAAYTEEDAVSVWRADFTKKEEEPSIFDD